MVLLTFRPIRFIILPFLLLMLCPGLSVAQDAEPRDPNAWFMFHNQDGSVQSLEELMAQFKVPGLSLYVVRNMQPDTLITLGFRDRENKLPVEANTLFQMGGMSSSLVRFALLREVEAGKIDLDRPANDYLKNGRKIPQKRFTKRQPVTVRDLLLQRRGFPVRSKPPGYAPGQDIPTKQQILQGKSPANTKAIRLVRSKNKSGNTSFDNNFLLGLILEDVLGLPLDNIIQRNVLSPLGMTESTLSLVLTPIEAQRAAVGYDRDGNRLPGDRWIYPERACANLWSTTGDYAKFVLHLYRAQSGEDNSLISQDLARQCFNPEKEGDYRSLIFYRKYDPYWGGASKGFRSQFEGKPETGFLVVGLANKWEAWEFMAKVTGMAWDFGRREEKQ